MHNAEKHLKYVSIWKYGDLLNYKETEEVLKN